MPARNTLLITRLNSSEESSFSRYCPSVKIVTLHIGTLFHQSFFA